MSFFDVIIDNSNNLDYLLEKDNFNINFDYKDFCIDLRDKMPSLDRYELLGSTANSIAILIEYDIPNYKCSKIYLYYNERLNTDTYNLNNSIKSILMYGFCENTDYKYESSMINTEPPKEIYEKAKEMKYKFEFIKLKKNLNSLCASLLNNEPIIISILIYESFNINTYEIKLPSSNEKQLGGITIIICGFNMSNQTFIIQLLNKYYEIPFMYILTHNYSSIPYIFMMRNFINFTNNIATINELPNINLNSSSSIDLRTKFPPVYDQGKIGSCTANALCSIFEYDTDSFKGSRLFLYYNERLLINETDKDNGGYLSDGILTLKNYGICEEKYWPYIIENIFNKPSEEAYEKAKINYVIEAISISNELEIIKYWLNKNEPIALGIAIYSNFVNFSSSKNGKIGLPTNDDKFIGGHAVILCGYNDNTQQFLLRNSWGSYWGENGYFYLPYSYITDNNLCGDLWIITKIKSI